MMRSKAGEVSMARLLRAAGVRPRLHPIPLESSHWPFPSANGLTFLFVQGMGEPDHSWQMLGLCISTSCL